MGLTLEQTKDVDRALGTNYAALHPAMSGGKSKERELLDRLDAAGAPPTKAVDDGMNKTERRFANGLGFMEDRGLIRAWAFEPEKFRMADRTWFTPDFRVTLLDGRNIFVEVKVLKKDGAVLWTDDGAVKAKTVPEMHPYAFFLAAYGDHRWIISRLPSRNYWWIDVDIKWGI